MCLCVDIVPFSLDNLNTFSSVDTDTREGVQVVQTDTVEFM